HGPPSATQPFFVFHGQAPSDISPLSLHDALPILARALGGRTVKMHQGHHGANHPVKDHATGKVEIVSMNHGFTVDASSLPQGVRSEEHTSELQSRENLVCRLLLEKKNGHGIAHRR